MKKMKWLALMLAAVMVVGCLAGCGSSSSDSDSSDSADASGSSSYEGVELNILMEDVPDTEYVIDLLDEFEEETGITVNVESVSYSVMHEKLLTQLTANESDYDVLVVDCYWTGEFIEAGWLEDLTDYIAEDEIDTSVYVDSMWEMFNPDGTSYMLPFYNYTFGLIYRTDIFGDEDLLAAYEAEYGTTYDMDNLESLAEYVQICKFVTEYYEDEGISGTVCQAMRGDPIAMEYLNYLYSNGGEVIDDDGNVVVNSDAAVEALELYMDNIENGSTEGAASFSLEETTSIYLQGGTASFISYNWELAEMDNSEDSTVSGLNAITNVPGGHALNAGWGWAIPSNAVNKDASWEFIKYIESYDSCKARALAGGSPTRTDIFEDEDCLEAYPYYTEILEIMETAMPIPVLADTPSMIDAMGQELSSAVAGEKTAQEALDDLAAEIEELLAE